MSGSRRAGRLTIGAVLERLKSDYPDISISKIRFLESEGLIKPQRTASGYRTFTDEDVQRLDYILSAQRDRFWPLKVIKDALDAIDRGLTPPDPSHDRPQVPRVPDLADLPSAADLRAPASSSLRLTRDELGQAAGLDRATVDALCTYGLLRADADGHFPASALPVATAAAALSGYGIEARHLRAFRTAADREIGLVEQVLAPLRGARNEQRRDEVAAELLRECIALHAALVRAALSGR